MQADLYTKTVLTVIAIAMCVNLIDRMVSRAEAQATDPTPVVLVDWQGRSLATGVSFAGGGIQPSLIVDIDK